MQRSNSSFHPFVTLLWAAIAILAYVSAMRWRFPGVNLSDHFVYVLPIIIPFVSFMFDRTRCFQETRLLELIIDSAVVVTSILRALGAVPFVSGHALFLTYAMVRPGSRLTRIAALIVMLEVIYLKLFIWDDPITPATGVALGLLASLIVRRVGARANVRPLVPLPSSK